MITMNELLSGNNFDEQGPETQANLNALLVKVNLVRAKYGKIMNVSSGLRTLQHHLEIYREIAAKKGIPFDESKVPLQSKHLYGQAADFVPESVEDFKQWCLDNDDFLRETGIWMESFHSTPSWVHMQSVQYGSFKEGASLQFNP